MLFMSIRIVDASTIVTDFILEKANSPKLPLRFGSINRSSENLTSSAVTGSPLEKLACRKWKV